MNAKAQTKAQTPKSMLRNFVAVFAFGQGVEVISGQQTSQQTKGLADLCEVINLLASCGSDFHVPDKPWAELGTFARMPANVTPVWDPF